MPIYDYQCSSCGFKKEVMRKISEPNVTECPECHKETFTKQLSAPSFQLTGSGWYVTDFKNNGSKPAPTASKERAAGDPVADGKSADTKAPAESSGSEKAESKKTETPAAKPAAEA